MIRVSTAALALAALTACDYSGDWLFAGKVEGVPGIDHLGDIPPATITSQADIDAAVTFNHVGPTGSAEKGGVTFTFQGTGGHVCLIVDPELAFWNQSVSARKPVPKWAWPDNVQDDGDLDLYAGLAAYYNGTPARDVDGGQIGDFKVRYEDSLGEEITISLNECRISGRSQDQGGHSGRGAPEFCTIENTQPGVSYLVLLETYSTPLDDDVLSYGLLVAHGDCFDEVFERSSVDVDAAECLIKGEARDIDGNPIPGSVAFEETFCNPSQSMAEFCAFENDQVEQGAKDCADEHCFCGDPSDTPTGGGGI